MEAPGYITRYNPRTIHLGDIVRVGIVSQGVTLCGIDFPDAWRVRAEEIAFDSRPVCRRCLFVTKRKER